MKKKLILGSLCFLLLTGCSKETVDNPNVNQDVSDEVAIIEKRSESQRDSELEALIIETYEIPESFYEQTAYYYNYVDLNDDGVDEIFAVFIGPFMSGSGGNSAAIISQTNDKLEIVQNFTLIHTPVIISDTTTNGYHNIITLRSGGGAETQYVELTYEKTAYESVNEATVIESLDSISGQSIITNDIVEDRDDGFILTLE